MRLSLKTCTWLALSAAAGCAPPARFVPAPERIDVTSPTSDGDVYVPVTAGAAALLGCAPPASPLLSPVCEIALPSAAEDSAFRTESDRLRAHASSRCRQLGEAVAASLPGVRMYRKAVVRNTGIGRLYGVGHTYEIDDTWLIRVARRIDDLNPRTLQEMTRTLRHEVSHTLGAIETPGADWSAEDYADRCG
ncbi:MAG: hypothetical protein H0U59_06290 [Gemmatimonadaceae bacterium]|nr:hypothetical protein [Gemmatimonadaceae bacterium]MDQ3243038.1 hypothetical protein [Gemmatimonadota bacterium]